MLLKLILMRVFTALWVLLAVSLFLFIAVETLPGDFASASAPRFTTADQIEATRERLGLNIAPMVRYIDWLTRAAEGDFGLSWYSRQPIAGILSERLGHTALLGAFAAAIAVPLGFGLGVVSVIYRGGRLDRAITSGSLVAISLPEFLVAYLLMALFTIRWPVFDAFTVFTDEMGVIDRLGAMVLPAAALSIVAVAPVLRLTRASLISIFASPYVEMARLKGLPILRIVLRHMLPNAIAPIVNAVVIVIANLLAGAFVVEAIFSYPGIGVSMVSAVKFRDIPLVLSAGLIFALFFVVLNLIADIVSILSDPKARDQQERPDGAPFRWRRPRRRFLGAGVAGLAALAAAWAMGLAPEREAYPIRPGLVVQSGERSALTIAELRDIADGGAAARHYSAFLPVGEAGAAAAFAGEVAISAFQMRRSHPFQPERSAPNLTFPALRFHLLVKDGVALPIEREVFHPTGKPGWRVILSPGRAWAEAGEGGWSRLSLPVLLIPPGIRHLSNGVLTFAYRDGQATGAQIQFGQEGAPDSAKTDMWGRGAVAMAAANITGGEAAFAQYKAERATDFAIADWAALEVRFGAMPVFDNDYIRPHVSVSGLLVDDVIYLRSCATRFGPYPYCDRLRHPVASVSKSLGAGVAMLRLAQKYGPEVFDERILDHAPLRPDHDGWRDVTFADALNMTTGIGELRPTRVQVYVDTDFTVRERAVWNAGTVERTLHAISGYRSYPWGPGEVMRYKSSETILLSIAMDRLIKSREGDDHGLWRMMVEEIYRPLGVHPIPTVMIRDGGRTPIPQYGGGMLPNIQEILKLSKLLKDGGVSDGRQILHADLTARAISDDMGRGVTTWSRYDDGSVAHYDMSFWLTPFGDGGCRVRVPQMVGYGGNYVSMAPNGVIGFRFADGRETVDDTYDSAGVRAAAAQVAPFCP